MQSIQTGKSLTFCRGLIALNRLRFAIITAIIKFIGNPMHLLKALAMKRNEIKINEVIPMAKWKKVC